MDSAARWNPADGPAGKAVRGRRARSRGKAEAGPPPGRPIYFVTAILPILWSAGPLAFAVGYRSAIAPLASDAFALTMVTLVALSPSAMLWAAAVLFKEAERLDLTRAQTLQFLHAQRTAALPEAPEQVEAPVVEAEVIETPAANAAPAPAPAEALAASPEPVPEPPRPEPAATVLATPAEDGWLRALREAEDDDLGLPPHPESPPAAANARGASWLLAELSRMGIQPRRLLPERQLAEVDRASEAGESGRAREIVSRMTGVAPIRIASRVSDDPGFADAVRSFLGGSEWGVIPDPGVTTADVQARRRLLETAVARR
jgi:hypothetical protein